MRHFDKSIVGADSWLMQPGTLSGNPITAAVDLKTTEILRRDGSYDQLRTTGRTLEMMQSDALSQAGIAHQICGDDTLFDIFFTNAPCRDFHTAKHDDQRLKAVCNDVLRKHGVFKSPGKLRQSLAITDADLEQSKGGGAIDCVNLLADDSGMREPRRTCASQLPAPLAMESLRR